MFTFVRSVPPRDGHRESAHPAAREARSDAHVQDPAEHRQPRGVLQGAAHVALQRLPQGAL